MLVVKERLLLGFKFPVLVLTLERSHLRRTTALDVLVPDSGAYDDMELQKERSASSVDGCRELTLPTPVDFHNRQLEIQGCDAVDHVAHQEISSIQFQRSTFVAQSHRAASDEHPGQSISEGKKYEHDPAGVDEDRLELLLISDVFNREIMVSGSAFPPVELPNGSQTSKSHLDNTSNVTQPIRNEKVDSRGCVKILPGAGSYDDLPFRRKSLEESKRQVAK